VDRNFNKYTNRVRALHDGVLKAVADGHAALTARNSAALTSAQVEGSKQMKELEEIVVQ